jgi:ABC-type nitrate/sulfonate/bicarbonate transport system permease component
MIPRLLIANIDRAGDHARVLGILLLIALVGALGYGLVQVVRKRAVRARSDGSGSKRAQDTDWGPET